MDINRILIQLCRITFSAEHYQCLCVSETWVKMSTLLFFLIVMVHLVALLYLLHSIGNFSFKYQHIISLRFTLCYTMLPNSWLASTWKRSSWQLSDATLPILTVYLDISDFLWDVGKAQSSHLEQSPPRQNRSSQLLCNTACLPPLHGQETVPCLRHETDYPVLYPYIS